MTSLETLHFHQISERNCDDHKSFCQNVQKEADEIWQSDFSDEEKVSKGIEVFQARLQDQTTSYLLCDPKLINFTQSQYRTFEDKLKEYDWEVIDDVVRDAVHSLVQHNFFAAWVSLFSLLGIKPLASSNSVTYSAEPTGLTLDLTQTFSLSTFHSFNRPPCPTLKGNPEIRVQFASKASLMDNFDHFAMFFMFVKTTGPTAFRLLYNGLDGHSDAGDFFAKMQIKSEVPTGDLV